MKKYDLVIFDADHTLFDFDKAEENALSLMMEEMGSRMCGERLALYRKLNMELWKLFEKKKIGQEEIKIERFRRFFKKIGLDADFNVASSVYLEYLSQQSWLLEYAEELIENLYGKIEIGLITNGLAQVQHPRYEKSGLKGYFKAFMVSEDVGVAKPDPTIFEKMMENFPGIDKKGMLMVGDSLSSDIAGGINFGIDTCWFNPKGLKADGGIRPTYEIRDLRHIYEILGIDNI
jgi:putative hydrolase of the HAD superfamily